MSIKLANELRELKDRLDAYENRICALEALATEPAPEPAKVEEVKDVVQVEELVKPKKANKKA